MGVYDKKSTITREVIHEPSVLNTLGVQVMAIEEHQVTWVDLYKDYLLNENLSRDKIEARKIQEMAVINDKLYRKSNSDPLLCCLTPDEARRLMEEIHEGVCRNHSKGRSLANKILSIGYFWPYMMTEA